MRLSQSGNSLGRLGVVVEDVEEEPDPPAEAGLVVPPEDVVDPPAEAEPDPEAGLAVPPEGGVVPEAGLVVPPEGGVDPEPPEAGLVPPEEPELPPEVPPDPPEGAGVVPLFLFLPALALVAPDTSLTTLTSPITLRVASRALPALLLLF